MLRLLTIHEAVPGHYLQGVYANRCPSIVRAIFASGLFAEGWAVYVTQVMMDVGYGADDPALLLVHWKFYLRSITNAIIDAKIHCDGMTEEEAVALMVDGGFQEQAEARAKFDRARLSSTQLSTYFAGSLEMWDIEREVRRRAAIASGDGRAARMPSRNRGSSVGSARRLASAIGRTSNPCWPMARHRRHSCGGSFSGRDRLEVRRFGAVGAVLAFARLGLRGRGLPWARRRVPRATGRPGSRLPLLRPRDAPQPGCSPQRPGRQARRSRPGGRPTTAGRGAGRDRDTRRPPRC